MLDVGTGIPMTVLDVAQTIIKMTGSHSEIQHLPMRLGEPEASQIVADVINLRNHIPVELTSFDIGMIPTLEYYAKLPIDEVERTFRYFNV